jgi:hypothetical protein
MHTAFDISETGSGKTFIAISVAENLIKLGLCDNIIFIIPNESRKIWQKFASRLPVRTCIITHTVTSDCKINGKTLVIVDEIQGLTSSAKSIHFSAIVKSLRSYKGRILLVSGTPFSDYNHAYTMFTSLMLIDLPSGKPKLMDLKKFDYRKYISDHVSLIEKIKSKIDDKELYADSINMYDCPAYDGRISNRITVLHQVIMRIYSSECPRILPPTLVIKQFNHVYNIQDVDEYRGILKQFKSACGFAMNPFLKKLHFRLLPFLADASIKELESKDNSKIIVAVFDNQHVDYLNLFFGQMGYAAIVITSGIDQLNRQTSQTLFNMYNLIYRVIIVTFSVANCGISLHDTAPRDLYPDGFPRTLISLIDIDHLRRTQLLGRHIRTGITSDTVSTIIVSSDVTLDGVLEKDVLMSKSKADLELITLSLKSTDNSTEFPTKYIKENEIIYNSMVSIMNSLDEYVEDE